MMEMCLDTHRLSIQYGQWGPMSQLSGTSQRRGQFVSKSLLVLAVKMLQVSVVSSFRTQGQSLFPLKATAFLRSVATFMVIMPLRTKMHRIHPHAKKRIHLVPWKISWCKTRSGRASSTNTVSFSKKEID